LVGALEYLLLESSLYPVLSTLPPPNPTNPTSTTTFATQEAVHNSLPILEEIIALVEKDEDETVRKEIDKRRTRMNGPGLEELKKEVGREIWGASKVKLSMQSITLCGQ
jgi:superkiller protein 3